MTDASALLDLPALAISVLRRYMRERAENNQPVSWYEDGIYHQAQPDPSKSEGAWQVNSKNWGYYRDKSQVLEAIDKADTFELMTGLGREPASGDDMKCAHDICDLEQT